MARIPRPSPPLRDWAPQWDCARFASITELIGQWSDHHTELRRLTELPQTAQTIAAAGLSVASLRFEAPSAPLNSSALSATTGAVVEAAVDAGLPTEAERVRAATLQALDQRQLHGSPYICLTSVDRVGAPVGELGLAPEVDTLDWEVEIGAVIGSPLSRLTLPKRRQLLPATAWSMT